MNQVNVLRIICNVYGNLRMYLRKKICVKPAVLNKNTLSKVLYNECLVAQRNIRG